MGHAKSSGYESAVARAIHGPLTGSTAAVVMESMPETVYESAEESTSSAPPMEVALCIDDDALMRLRAIIRHLCVGLIDRNVKLRVVSPSGEAAPLAALGPIEVVHYKPPVWAFRRGSLRRIRETLVERPPSAVYAISGGSFEAGEYLSEEFGAGLCVGLSTWRDVEAVGTLRGRRRAIRVAAGEPLLKRLQEMEGVDPDHQRLVRPGVQRGPESTCFHEADRVPSLVCTSRLEARFGISVVIDAAAHLRDRGHPFLVFFTGEGRQEDDLRRRVQLKRLSSEVTFARATAEPADILRGADVLIIPPGDEDISARPLQAMANGTAVVCFSGGCADFYRAGQTAVVCGERTAESLASGIESLLIDPGLARRLARSAREYVIVRHSMSAMCEQTHEALRKAGGGLAGAAAAGAG